MNKFVCEECGRFSYSSANMSTMNDDRCPYSGCNGHVIPENEGGNMEDTIKEVDPVMMNWKCWDKWNQTVVVLAHNAEHAIERAYEMYLFRAVRVELINQ